MNRTLFAAILCVATPGLALPHAALDGEVVPGNAAELSVRIGHGCDGMDVTAVEVELPEGLAGIRPMAKPGWDIAVDGRTIRWSGASLSDAHYDRFPFRARAAAEVADGTPVPVRQFCGDVEVAWIEVAAPGQNPHDLPFPAPLLKVAGVAAAPADHHHGHGQAASEGAAALGDLTIADAYARAPAAPGGASAAYMTISTTGTADRLVAASSPDAARVELHTHILDDAGVARMREVEAIDVSRDAPAELKPGGLHVMLMGPRPDMAAGQTISLTLTFETAGEVTLQAPVIAAGRGQAAGHDHDHGHDHGHGHSHGN
jgi:copper(I)-binding protein/uncharacterized protein YcnI